MSFFARLSNRSVFRVSGDAWTVIKNLTTTDGPGYCHWLNPQGRILFEGFVQPHEKDWLIEIDSSVAAQFKKHFALYSLRKKVSLVEEPLFRHVMHVSDDRAGKHGLWFEDRRLRRKCWRLYCENVEDVASRLPQRDGRYDTLKILNGCAENAAVLPPGKYISLECNLEQLGGVSFEKGCYLGQELVSRAHFTGVVRKRLLPVLVGDHLQVKDSDLTCSIDDAIRLLEASSSSSSSVLAAANGEELLDEKGKECGTVFCVGKEFPHLALAMVRLQHVEDKSLIRSSKQGIRIRPIRIT